MEGIGDDAVRDRQQRRGVVEASRFAGKEIDLARCARQFAEQAAIVAEVETHPLGNREDQLPVRHRLADRVGDRLRRKQRAFLMTAGAQASKC